MYVQDRSNNAEAAFSNAAGTISITVYYRQRAMRKREESAKNWYSMSICTAPYDRHPETMQQTMKHHDHQPNQSTGQPSHSTTL